MSNNNGREGTVKSGPFAHQYEVQDTERRFYLNLCSKRDQHKIRFDDVIYVGYLYRTNRCEFHKFPPKQLVYIYTHIYMHVAAFRRGLKNRFRGISAGPFQQRNFKIVVLRVYTNVRILLIQKAVRTTAQLHRRRLFVTSDSDDGNITVVSVNLEKINSRIMYGRVRA